MTLNEYLKTSRGEAIRLAKAVGVTPVYLRNIAYGERQPSKELAVAIEKESGGAVTVEEMHPEFAELLVSAGYVRAVPPASTD
jgi:DNA-binding transcriptional regulator YdaS (Cro superfamily)